MHAHGTHRVEDKHGRWWRSTTFHRWWYGDSQDAAERGTNRWMVSVGGQWHVDSLRYMREHPQVLRLKLSLTGEETIDTALALGPACLYLHLDLEVPQWTKCPLLAACDRVAEMLAADLDLPSHLTVVGPHGPECRECYGVGEVRARRHVRIPVPLRVTLDLTLKGVTWCLGHDDHSWHRDSPWRERLRTNHLTWWKLHGYRRACEDIETVDTHVDLPEDRYPVTLTLQREVWQLRVGPYWPTRTRRTPRVEFYIAGTRRVRWSVKIDAPTGLPVPGKGENSWDCGPDAIYGTGVTLEHGPYDSADREWIAAALAQAVAATFRSRARYGSGVTDTGR